MHPGFRQQMEPLRLGPNEKNETLPEPALPADLDRLQCAAPQPYRRRLAGGLVAGRAHACHRVVGPHRESLECPVWSTAAYLERLFGCGGGPGLVAWQRSDRGGSQSGKDDHLGCPDRQTQADAEGRNGRLVTGWEGSGHLVCLFEQGRYALPVELADEHAHLLNGPGVRQACHECRLVTGWDKTGVRARAQWRRAAWDVASPALIWPAPRRPWEVMKAWT